MNQEAVRLTRGAAPARHADTATPDHRRAGVQPSVRRCSAPLATLANGSGSGAGHPFTTGQRSSGTPPAHDGSVIEAGRGDRRRRLAGHHSGPHPAGSRPDLAVQQALVAADAALHHRLLTRGDLEAQLELSRNLPGALAGWRVVSFADGRSESVGESRSRIMIHRVGLPKPELQLTVVDQRDPIRCQRGLRLSAAAGDRGV